MTLPCKMDPNSQNISTEGKSCVFKVGLPDSGPTHIVRLSLRQMGLRREPRALFIIQMTEPAPTYTPMPVPALLDSGPTHTGRLSLRHMGLRRETHHVP